MTKVQIKKIYQFSGNCDLRKKSFLVMLIKRGYSYWLLMYLMFSLKLKFHLFKTLPTLASVRLYVRALCLDVYFSSAPVTVLAYLRGPCFWELLMDWDKEMCFHPFFLGNYFTGISHIVFHLIYVFLFIFFFLPPLLLFSLGKVELSDHRS